MALAMMAAITAMGLAATAFVFNDLQMIRKDAIHHLSVLAGVLGANTTAALTFDDREAAEQLLDSLRMQPMVTAALVFDQAGEPFATYPVGLNATLHSSTDEFADYNAATGHLEVVRAIMAGEERIGTIYLRGDLELIRHQLYVYAGIVTLVVLVAGGAAYLLASYLQKFISAPILEITSTVQRISREKDYRLRVVKQGNDELGTLCDEFNRMVATIEASKHALELAHEELEARVERRTRQLSQANDELNKEIGERRRAELELEHIHRDFVDAARKAGMAEIATGVLHNVGNVLNSVNVSATMLTNLIKASKRPQLTQVVGLLEEHQEDLGEFITKDDKGKQVPRFLKVLSDHLAADERMLLEEARSLIDNVDHIKTIISTQQSYATSGGMVEPVDLNVLLDDASRLHSMSFGKHGIELRRDYADLPTLLVDKQRLLQIVINLIKNAKESLTSKTEGERVLTVHTRQVDDRLRIGVSDTGIGIKKDQLEKIFSHGFTTKVSGHGFGLHSCANAATEMEGKLTVYSDGEMQGATFVLDLPFKPASSYLATPIDIGSVTGSLAENTY